MPLQLHAQLAREFKVGSKLKGFLPKVGGKIFVCSKLGGFCKSGRYVDQVPFWEFTHVSQQDPHERTMSRFTLFWHDFTLFWQDFGTIAQTGTPRMSWRDRSQKVTSHFDIVGLRHRESRMEAPRAQALTPRRCGAIAMLKWNLCVYNTRVMLLCIICGHNVPFKMKLKASTRRVNRSASGGSNDTSNSCNEVNKKTDIHDKILIHAFRRENLN
jgi:hypothetical protein